MPTLGRPRSRRAVWLGLAAALVAAATFRVVTASQPAPPPAPLARRLVTGDFDCDGVADLVRPERDGVTYVWYGSRSRDFARQPFTGARDRPAVAGDFDGDRCDDVLWQDSAGAHEVWFGRKDREFDRRRASGAAATEPYVADFDGDGASDVLWPGPDRAGQLWYGGPARAFARVPVRAEPGHRPVVGDFDGDGPADVLWHEPGRTRGELWLGRANRTFGRRTAVVPAADGATTGDFDGDRRRDVLWYGGSATALSFGRPDARFDRTAVELAAGRAPAATGDVDGDGRDDVWWQAERGGPGPLWHGQADRGFRPAASLPLAPPPDLPAPTPPPPVSSSPVSPTPPAPSGSPTPTAPRTPYAGIGDFDGDRRADLLFEPAGSAPAVWYGASPAAATVPPVEDVRALPLRPETVRTAYRPYGYVAHALGAIGGHTHTSTVEAFDHSIALGLKVFEVDMVRLADGSVFCGHDNDEPAYGLEKGAFPKLARADVAGRLYRGRYHTMFAEDMVARLRTHRDVYLVLDTKYDHVEIFRTLVGLAADDQIVHRMLPHIEGQQHLDGVRAVYPVQSYVVALYRTQWKGALDDDEVVDLVRRNHAPAVMMWWLPRRPGLSLKANAQQHRRFTVAFARRLQAAGAVVYVHGSLVHADVPRFRPLGVGVYADEGFLDA